MMPTPEIFLAALFLITIFHLLTLKVCSLRLDHHTAPLFISGWTLAGLALVWPLFGHLLWDGMAVLADRPFLLGMMVAKSGFLYLLFVISQRLTQVSLSARHYVTPLSVGLIVLVNAALGERLTGPQALSCMALFALSAAFFFKGHLADLGRRDRLAYLQLVGICVVLSAFDHVLVGAANWYTTLLITNIFLFGGALGANIRRPAVLRAAFFSPAAALAGVCYAAAELVKFYQMVEINPISVIVLVQALTKPVILVLSALIWKERTVREQLMWGILAIAAALPLLWPMG